MISGPIPFSENRKSTFWGSCRAGMIAPTADGCKRAVAGAPKFAGDGLSVTPARQKMQRHEIVREIIIRPNFRPATAVLNCDKESLRWPGPFSPGFLSPQPPGVVGIGPVRRNSLSPSWANASWSFFFLGWPSFPDAQIGASEMSEPESKPRSGVWIPRLHIHDVQLPIGE